MKWPALWTLVSFIVRTGMSMLVLYFLIRGGYWQRAVSFLIGFLLARIMLVRHLRPKKIKTAEKDA